MVVELSSFTCYLNAATPVTSLTLVNQSEAKRLKKNPPFSSRKTDLSTITQYQNSMKYMGNCPGGCAVLSLANQGTNVCLWVKRAFCQLVDTSEE